MTTNKTIRRHTGARTTMLLLLLLPAACADIKMRAGRKVDVDRMKQFMPGRSTAAEIRQTLGEPYGRGRTRLPYQRKSLDTWTYYYELGTLSDTRRTFLFVYVDGGVYDGHMWFSSLPEEHR